MLAAEQTVYDGYAEDYTEMIPVFRYPSEEARGGIMENMATAIEKCETVVNKHSIEARGEEYTEWMDDAHFVIGQAYFYRGEFAEARQMFNYVAKKYKEKNRKPEAQIWLARTYMEQGNLSTAENILGLVDGNRELDPKLMDDLKLTMTDLYIRKKEYDMAIPELMQAIEFIKDRHFRMRETYLLGQLFHEEGDNYMSSKQFKRVIKKSPDYDMVFYSELNLALTSTYENGGVEETRERLLKMAAEEKNKEYRDQIYYALGRIDERIGDTPQALDDYLTSAQVSLENTPQKAKSFLRLGEIYFDERDYRKSQQYFDSCMLYLDPEFERFEQISLLSENLNDLIAQLTIIEEQDSLQALAKMPEDQLAQVIEDEIKRKIKEEEEREEAELRAMDESLNDQGPGGLPGMPGQPGQRGGGGWMIYDPVLKGQGAADFKKTWGNRKNEDNWRRSIKRQIAIEDPIEGEEGEGEQIDAGFFVNNEGDTVRASSDWMEPEYYMKDIPFTEEAVSASNDLMVEAYYALGGIYRDQLFDLPLSIESLETMNKRFDQNAHLLESYYALYRMFTDLGDQVNAKKYRQLILLNYPDSDYAKLINDPKYLEKAGEANSEAYAFYKKTYAYFEKGYYTQVIDNCDKGMSTYADTPLKSKFALLKALCIGATQGKDAYLSALKSVVSSYGESEDAMKAQQLINAIENPVEIEEPSEKLVEYLTPITGKHVVVILINREATDLNKALASVSDFNRKLFRMDGLKTNQIIFNDSLSMFTVKEFNQDKRALFYVKNFKNDKQNLADINKTEFSIYAISLDNYALFFKGKDIEGYEKFYQEHYK